MLGAPLHDLLVSIIKLAGDISMALPPDACRGSPGCDIERSSGGGGGRGGASPEILNETKMEEASTSFLCLCFVLSVYFFFFFAYLCWLIPATFTPLRLWWQWICFHLISSCKLALTRNLHLLTDSIYESPIKENQPQPDHRELGL